MQNFKRKAIALIPNIITLTALIAGLTSIRFSQSGFFGLAAFAIILAALFDVMDGFAARSLKVESHFGAELDSLADLISFGVAPSMLLYYRKLYILGEFGWALAAAYVLAAGLRLARFNVAIKPSETHQNYFIGLPTTASALILVIATLISNDETVFAILITVASLLMISSVRFPKLAELISRL